MRAEVRARIERARVVAIVRSEDPDAALNAARAIIDGGLDVVEISLTTPQAVEVIGALIRTTTACIGAGTVLTVAQVDRVALAGAAFLVAPNLDESVVRTAVDAGLVVGPGVFTATECARALAVGADYLKLFPAAVAGVAGLTALRGPFPAARWLPTGGIGAADAAAWLAAGASAVGIGGRLTGGDPAAITARTRTLCAGLAGAEPTGLPVEPSPAHDPSQDLSHDPRHDPRHDQKASP